MNKFIYIFLIAISSFLLFSCQGVGFETIITDEDVSSLYIKGEPVVALEQLQMQYAYDAATISYRTMEDSMSSYFSIKLNEPPTAEGQAVKGRLSYHTPKKSEELREMEYQVIKIDSSKGLVWLWNSSRNIKVVIRQI